ncbi:MAG: PAS domain-containing protein [Shinella sp.]|nr:MAG: PAS domain-containing protein [Shinella sp.]
MKTGVHMYQRMTCRDIYAYWDALRGEAASPMRSQIEPAAIRMALPDLFMLESTEEGDLSFRLVGTRMCALFGRELRGHSFNDLWAGGPNSNPVDIAQGVIAHESPVLMNLLGFFHDGETSRFEMLLLPIRSAEGLCDRLMGALVLEPGEPNLLTAQTLRYLYLERSRPLKGARPAAATGTPRNQSAAL